jgi:hypothetical protein
MMVLPALKVAKRYESTRPDTTNTLMANTYAEICSVRFKFSGVKFFEK